MIPDLKTCVFPLVSCNKKSNFRGKTIFWNKLCALFISTRKIQKHFEDHVRELAAALEPVPRSRREIEIPGADGRVASSIQKAHEKSAAPHCAPDLQSSGLAYKTPGTADRRPLELYQRNAFTKRESYKAE